MIILNDLMNISCDDYVNYLIIMEGQHQELVWFKGKRSTTPEHRPSTMAKAADPRARVEKSRSATLGQGFMTQSAAGLLTSVA